MKKFKLHFTMDNAAFEDGQKSFEVARILRDIAQKVEEGDVQGRRILDINGNSIGEWGEK